MPIKNELLVQNLEDMQDRQRIKSESIDFDGYTTNGCMSSPYGKRMLLRGVEELQRQKSLTNLIVCGRHVDELDIYDNVHYYPSFSQRWKERAV